MTMIMIDKAVVEQALEALCHGIAEMNHRGCAIECMPLHHASKPLREAMAQPQPVQDDVAYKEAANLATALFKKHFAHEEHYASGKVVWELCDTTAGVISQIDNMVSGLVQLKQEPVAWSVFDKRTGKHWYTHISKRAAQYYANAYSRRESYGGESMVVYPLYTVHCITKGNQ